MDTMTDAGDPDPGDAGGGDPHGGNPDPGDADRGDPHGGVPDPTAARARESVEHLQAAARELIEAARTVLDVAEEWVNDPQVAASLTSALGTVGEVARRFAASGRRAADGATTGGATTGGAATGRTTGVDEWAGAPWGDRLPADGAASDDEPRIQRITVT